MPAEFHTKSADRTQQIQLNPQTNFANQGNQGRAQDTAKSTTRRKSSEWSAFWKNLLRRYYESAACRKIRFLELAKGFEPPTL